jgi:hypothetical protein
MSALTILVFSLPVLTGTLIAHLLWVGKNNLSNLTLKLSLGIGVGLGISSLSYFIYLIFFAGNPYFVCVELAILLIVVAAVYLKNKTTAQVSAPRLGVNFLQIAILVIAGVVSVSSLLGVVNYARQRTRGDWDTWMIYNRAARFIYRAPATWQDAFSSNMDLVFHADYPPLLALNIASHWEILGEETAFVPMFQSILFAFASLGLCFGALASLKSLGQAGLGLILLGGVHFFSHEGGRQGADVPLAFYMLASVAFLFFYYRDKRAILMVFAGFMAGLAAWTKNEGMLFMFASAGILFFRVLWKRSFQSLLLYFIGLLLPLALLFYFKFELAPPSEFLSGGSTKILQDLMDVSRHQIIAGSFKNYFLHSGWYEVGVFPILGAYFLFFYSRAKDNYSGVVLTSLVILACQFIGYYIFYLISPYDLEWHIAYSLARLFIHVYPAAVFVALAATQTPETAFSSNLE